MKEEMQAITPNNEKCVIELNHLFQTERTQAIWRTEDKRITDSGLGSGELPETPGGEGSLK